MISTKAEEVCTDICVIIIFRDVVFIKHIIACVAHIRMNPRTTTQWMMFWTGKITHCLFKYVVPYFYTPFWHLVSDFYLHTSYKAGIL